MPGQMPRYNILNGRFMADHELIPYPFLKWLTDRLLSLTLIILFSPVLIIIVSGIALNMMLCPADRGPWLYRERRTSRGKEFDLLKFRVLRVDIIAKMREEGGYARTYEADLSNLTWVGRYIKKWYFDELPQLFNIFKGDMSLVGPRPWALSVFKKQVERGIVYRKLIYAGWTGPAQVQKGNANKQDMEKLDLEYVARCRTWSGWRLWWYDLGLLYNTVRIMLQGQGLKY